MDTGLQRLRHGDPDDPRAETRLGDATRTTLASSPFGSAPVPPRPSRRAPEVGLALVANRVIFGRQCSY